MDQVVGDELSAFKDKFQKLNKVNSIILANFPEKKARPDEKMNSNSKQSQKIEIAMKNKQTTTRNKWKI